jgi:FkbM family methyltransferase
MASSRLPSSSGMLAYVTAWLLPWRSVFRVRARESGLAFYVHRRDAIGRHIAKYGGHEPELTAWIGDRLAAGPPGLFVDVGANIGWHALHAARHEPVEAVIAFEPDPFNAWLLDRNLTENGIDKVIVSACAVGAERGVARLNRYKAANLGRHSVITDYGHGSRRVPLVDLDGALDDLGFGERPVAMLKVDVEGFEPAVIAGARRTLARAGAVVLEYSPALSRAGGLSGDVMIAELQAAGLRPYRLQADGGVAPVGLDALANLDGVSDLIWQRADNGQVSRGAAG